MARGNNCNPAIIIIVFVLILLLIPTCICGGIFVLGSRTAAEMEGMEQNARDEVQRLTEEIHEREVEAAAKDNASELNELPAVEDESPQSEK